MNDLTDRQKEHLKLSELALQKKFPPEIIKLILQENIDIEQLAKECNKNPRFLKICTQFQQTICKEALEYYGYTRDLGKWSGNYCELLKPIMEIQKRMINLFLQDYNNLKNYINNFEIESDNQEIKNFIIKNQGAFNEFICKKMLTTLGYVRNLDQYKNYYFYLVNQMLDLNPYLLQLPGNISYEIKTISPIRLATMSTEWPEEKLQSYIDTIDFIRQNNQDLKFDPNINDIHNIKKKINDYLSTAKPKPSAIGSILDKYFLPIEAKDDLVKIAIKSTISYELKTEIIKVFIRCGSNIYNILNYLRQNVSPENEKLIEFINTTYFNRQS